MAVVSALAAGRGGPGAWASRPICATCSWPDGAAGSHLSWEDRIARAGSTLTAAPTSRDDAAFWLYSSGSTGFPKGAVHLHHDMVVCQETYAKQVLGIRESDRVYSAAKLFFAYGLGNAGYFPMGVGAQSVLYPHRPTPDSVFEMLSRHRATLFFGVPTLYAVDAGGQGRGQALRPLEPAPVRVGRRGAARGALQALAASGSASRSSTASAPPRSCTSSSRTARGPRAPGATGQPVPGYEAIVVDDDGRPVPQGEIGNLRVKGDSIMAYYWNKHEKTKETLFGPWIQTGDKYYQDADGYFWYCGRADDMLKVGGIWVSPVEVENTLVEHPAVLEAAVVGREDSDRLVKPQAFVVLKDPATRAGRDWPTSSRAS